MSKSKNIFKCGLVIVLLFACFLLTGCSNAVELNKEVEVKIDGVKITVLGSYDDVVDEGELSIRNGDYTKVKVSIENTLDDNYSWTVLNFQLGEETPSLNALTMDDALPLEVENGETMTGYIYFNKTDADTLTYISTNLNGKKAEKVEFNIK